MLLNLSKPFVFRTLLECLYITKAVETMSAQLIACPWADPDVLLASAMFNVALNRWMRCLDRRSYPTTCCLTASDS